MMKQASDQIPKPDVSSQKAGVEKSIKTVDTDSRKKVTSPSQHSQIFNIKIHSPPIHIKRISTGEYLELFSNTNKKKSTFEPTYNSFKIYPPINPQVTQVKRYCGCSWPGPSEASDGRAIAIKKSRSFSSATVTKQNNHGPRKMAKKSGIVLIPRERRTGVGRGVIPRKRGAGGGGEAGTRRSKLKYPQASPRLKQQKQTVESVCT